MKVLYLAPDPVPAPKGAGIRIAATVATLTAAGHDVRVFTPRSADGTSLTDVHHETVPLAPVDNFLARMLAWRRAAATWLADQQADAVMFRSIWEGIASVRWARANGARIIYEAHGFPSVELVSHYPELVGAPDVLDKIIREEQLVLSAADRLLTVSRTGRRYLMSRAVRPDCIRVVPNMVDTELFSPPPLPPSDEAPLRLVYVGTLAPWQGLDVLLEAMVPFRSTGAVELHVVGTLKSLWRRRIRVLARGLRVHHLLHLAGAMGQANLVPVLRTAHICIAPLPADPRNAHMGCCPLKILEYMAVGRPILATRVAPVEEILTADVNARLVNAGSPAALTNGLRWMLEHPKEREEYGAAARREAQDRWRPSLFRQRLLQGIED